ncbi:DUF4012 domain-containing protein [Nocardioides seonyuensis]|uniref:DUF4012 domain-containing protein n=1 Tax=Nocardioides seonyuensis TaxID=2518371 RepID=A0A4P7IF11_9ACTN|nr:DUF4012 domain-containing protein [Nocardioides seonyuensis]QBX55859.1 DUF4012 domain-containing protein [Nocardioides seonyuensis]
MPSSHRVRRTRRRLWPALLLLAGVAVVVALGVLALPFRHAPAHAEAAKADLQVAKEALTSGKDKKAEEAIAAARVDADALQSSVQGFGGDVWSMLPVLGGPVSDVRHLGNALDDLTAAAEAGAQAWPEVAGPKAELMQGGSVDVPTLEKVSEHASEAMDRLASAQAELDLVADDRLVIGDRLGAARDEAREQVTPLAERAERFGPLLDVLPDVVGANGKRTYVLAILNPAELLYSGGTPQTFTQMTYDNGKLQWEDTIGPPTAPWLTKEVEWPATSGNPFHRDPSKAISATTSPDWPVAGEELLSAWKANTGQDIDGVIALDVVAFADLLELTGPVELIHAGQVTSETVVETISGRYDDQLVEIQRHWTNFSLAKNFGIFLLGADSQALGQTLGNSAEGRHFAMYFDDAEEQEAFDALDVTGRLGDPDRDYLGVFSQNTQGTRADYWQRRAVSSDVKLRDDGSARVSLEVEIHNDSPPYLQPGNDPGNGVYTRWNHLNLLTLLPDGARLRGGTIDGSPLQGQEGSYDGRTFHEEPIEFAPQATHTLTLEYDVPAAATRGADGELRYGLSLDPQGMVVPQALSVRLRFPKGYVVTSVPPGWNTAGPSGASYTSAWLQTSESFEVIAR